MPAYIDNQSIGKDVWFDNLNVENYQSEVLEEDHYYPFGLPLNITPNSLLTGQPYKYQGIELEKHFGLEQYETLNRILDPQLGIFRQIDPKAELDYSLSPFVSMRNNPAYYTDPFGDVASDYYNLNAEKVKHVDDGTDDKKLVLTTTKKEAKVDKAIESGAVVNVPTDAAVDQMADVFDKSEKTGNEYGFLIGKDGKTSKTVEGTTGMVQDKEWREAKADLVEQGGSGSTDVHVHPLEKDANGKVVNYGMVKPSETDKTNPLYPSSGQPEIVLGYFQKTTQPPSGSIGVAPTVEYIKGIGFYNSVGLIHSTDIKFNDFLKTVKEINKGE